MDRHFRHSLGGVADMNANYTRWRKRLAGETVVAFTSPDESDVGFYRLPIRERAQDTKGNNNGRWKTIGWKPVALFVSGEDDLVCQIGPVLVTSDTRDEQWQWFVSHPISEEVWRAVYERGQPWPDFETAETVPAANRDVTAADNAPPEEPLDVQHATAIDNAIAAALKAVTNEAQAAQALGSKNRIAELRLKADKDGKSEYEPLYTTYVESRDRWQAPVKRATAKEKELNTAILTFREKERQRIYAEQEAAATKQREIDEANQRAADRAIAAGLPEPEPIVETVDAPVFEPAPIQPTYGTRKLKEELHTILDSITDYDAVYAFLKGEPKVKALLLELATAKVKAGFVVPGTVTHEGFI
jgi:hypothetical protein